MHLQMFDCGSNIRDLVADVIGASALLQCAIDWRIRTQRSNKLDCRVSAPAA